MPSKVIILTQKAGLTHIRITRKHARNRLKRQSRTFEEYGTERSVRNRLGRVSSAGEGESKHKNRSCAREPNGDFVTRGRESLQ
jgi:hypothetical protein